MNMLRFIYLTLLDMKLHLVKLFVLEGNLRQGENNNIQSLDNWWLTVSGMLFQYIYTAWINKNVYLLNYEKSIKACF